MNIFEAVPQGKSRDTYSGSDEGVITWCGNLINSYALQAASEKITRLANETVTMLWDKRTKVQKDDGTIPARAIIARNGRTNTKDET